MCHQTKVELSLLVGVAVAITGCGDAPSLPRGDLWYAGKALCGLSQEQLRGGGEGRPSVIVTTDALAAISDVALDDRGNAWVVGVGSDDVMRIPAVQLLVSGAATPDLILRSPALHTPGNLVFDAGGALWVANRDEAADGSEVGSIVRFDVPVGASGLVTMDPTAKLQSDTPGDLFQIGSLAFDVGQSLWVTSFAGIVRFDQPETVAGTVQMTPGAVIDKDGYGDNSYFYSVAFDANGALFSASGDGLHHLTRLTAFETPSALAGRSSPAPLFTVIGAVDSLPAGGLAFDPAGDLWMATGLAILRYASPASLLGTVDVAPSLSLGVSGTAAPTTNSHLLLSRDLLGQPGE